MRVLITGGHFSPAYSLISELKKRGDEVVIAGRRYPFEEDKSESYEYLVAKREDLPFYEIKTGRFQRKFTIYTAFSLFKTPAGLVNAISILKKSKPDIVVTFGGYIGLPLAYAAFLLGIPVVLHEQTQSAGLASRWICRIAKKICISFKESSAIFPKSKTVFTGNPLRKEIFEINKKFELLSKDVIYITGGSTGSHFINQTILKIIDILVDKFTIIHQTGESLRHRDFEQLSSLRESFTKQKQDRYILRKFIYPDEIGFVLKSADLLVARSGANTIFEIMALGKMSLLIPLPHGQNNEQLENAKFIKAQGIGEFIKESEASPEIILAKIEQMFGNRKQYETNMVNAEDYIIKDAAEKIADVIYQVNSLKNKTYAEEKSKK